MIFNHPRHNFIDKYLGTSFLRRREGKIRTGGKLRLAAARAVKSGGGAEGNATWKVSTTATATTDGGDAAAHGRVDACVVGSGASDGRSGNSVGRCRWTIIEGVFCQRRKRAVDVQTS